MNLLFLLIVLLVGGIFLAATLGNQRNQQKKQRRVPASGDLARNLQRIAAECTDGSVTIEEPARSNRRTPQVEWTERFDTSLLYSMVYMDSSGKESARFVRLIRRGTGRNGIVYIEAYDGARNKTFRQDRIIRIEEASN